MASRRRTLADRVPPGYGGVALPCSGHGYGLLRVTNDSRAQARAFEGVQQRLERTQLRHRLALPATLVAVALELQRALDRFVRETDISRDPADRLALHQPPTAVRGRRFHAQQFSIDRLVGHPRVRGTSVLDAALGRFRSVTVRYCADRRPHRACGGPMTDAFGLPL